MHPLIQAQLKLRKHSIHNIKYYLPFLECDSEHFKPTQGNERCTKCGLNSRSSIDRTLCNCLHKYKREVSEVNNPLAVCYSKFFNFFFKILGNFVCKDCFPCCLNLEMSFIKKLFS